MRVIKQQNISNAYDSVCQIISKTNGSYEGELGVVILYDCVGEKDRRKKRANDREREIIRRRNIVEREGEKEREARYTYIYPTIYRRVIYEEGNRFT